MSLDDRPSTACAFPSTHWSAVALATEATDEPAGMCAGRALLSRYCAGIAHVPRAPAPCGPAPRRGPRAGLPHGVRAGAQPARQGRPGAGAAPHVPPGVLEPLRGRAAAAGPDAARRRRRPGTCCIGATSCRTPPATRAGRTCSRSSGRGRSSPTPSTACGSSASRGCGRTCGRSSRAGCSARRWRAAPALDYAEFVQRFGFTSVAQATNAARHRQADVRPAAATGRRRLRARGRGRGGASAPPADAVRGRRAGGRRGRTSGVEPAPRIGGGAQYVGAGVGRDRRRRYPGGPPA